MANDLKWAKPNSANLMGLFLEIVTYAKKTIQKPVSKGGNHFDCQHLAIEVVHPVESAEATPTPQRIAHKVC